MSTGVCNGWLLLRTKSNNSIDFCCRLHLKDIQKTAMDSVSSIVRETKQIMTNKFQTIDFFDLNSYCLEHILKYLEVDDIKSISMVNRQGYTITNKYFETMCVLNLPEVVTSDVVEMLNQSGRRYKYAVYKLSRRLKGNILKLLESLPFQTTVRVAFYWKHIDELVLEQLPKNFQVELFPSQIKKANQISDRVTKINFSHRPLLVLSDIFNTFPNIRELHLSNVKDDGLLYEQEALVKPLHLKILRVSWGSFLLTPTLLNVFKGLTFLEFRFVKDVDFIKTLIANNETTLKHLILQLSTPEIASLSLSCQLTHLEIDSGNHNVSLEPTLKQQRNLRSLVLKSPLIDEFLLDFLESCITLTNLSVKNPRSRNIDVCRIKIPSVACFQGNVNTVIPIADNLKSLETETFCNNLRFNDLSDLHLIERQVLNKPHSNFDSFEDFRDYHVSEPLNHHFLRYLSSTTKLRVDWCISLHEFKKVSREMNQLELFHFRIRSQDFKEFYNFLFPTKCFKNLRFVVFKIDVTSVNEYCMVQNVVNSSIDEKLLGDFFRPFCVHVDLDFKNQKRNIIYFSVD